MLRVLVVEDETLVRRGIVNGIDWLSLGCVIQAEAKNGVEGLAAFQREPADIVLTDIQMPLMDGLTMAEKIREIDSEVAIIILTAYSEFNYARKALLVRAVDYLLKPFHDGEIEALIQKIAGRKIRNRAIKRCLSDLPQAANCGEIVRSAMAYIAEQYAVETLSISDIAGHLKISESHLSHVFKEETSLSVLQYLIRYRMQVAAYMLEDSRRRVSEVAIAVGYSDLSYFSRSFKKIIGRAPSEYQKY